ncbi:hypothetical protein CDD83_5468 [Cordyceps sp. RAO-2017]|nr:hypothetical protein CDD83_5468 [Cordyceps sp. RAO-2017]
MSPSGPPSSASAPASAADLLSPAAARPAMGNSSVSRFGSKPDCRSRWMASVGMRSSGRSTRTSRWATPPPSARRTMTRPAMLRSRSNHECQMPPPYVSTPTCRYPAADRFDTGLSRRQGESVWAPTMATAPPGRHRPPTAKAATVDPLRVT